MTVTKSLQGSWWSDGGHTADNPANSAQRSAADALDAAYAGEPCEIVADDGTVQTLPVRHWQRDADAADRDLFVRPCDGDVLDVGCGPGRLTVAAAGTGRRALGIDTSLEAVRQARARGANALQHNVYEQLPGGRWDHALLADGNVGIGGDPVRVLRRCAGLIGVGGRVVVEVAAHDGVRHQRLRLRVGDELSDAFAWASVGVGAIGAVAASAGLRVDGVATVAGRTVARLTHGA